MNHYLYHALTEKTLTLSEGGHMAFFKDFVKHPDRLQDIGIPKSAFPKVEEFTSTIKGDVPYDVMENFILREWPIVKATGFHSNLGLEMAFSYDRGCYTNDALDLIMSVCQKEKPYTVAIANRKTHKFITMPWSEMKDFKDGVHFRLGRIARQICNITL